MSSPSKSQPSHAARPERTCCFERSRRRVTDSGIRRECGEIATAWQAFSPRERPRSGPLTPRGGHGCAKLRDITVGRRQRRWQWRRLLAEWRRKTLAYEDLSQIERLSFLQLDS